MPVARGLQQFIYNTVGREFFTYTVVFSVFTVLFVLFYYFVFKLKVRRTSQYLWLLACAGLYIYFTIKLTEHPEEAVHFIEYGLLSYFLFIALNHRVRDWTIYFTIAFFISFVGTVDEFLQWILPSRVWDVKDIGLNILAGIIFLLGVRKGIMPESISEPVRKVSVGILNGILTANFLLAGICLSNTPKVLKRYTSAFPMLSWLANEEPMAEHKFSLSAVWLITLTALTSVWVAASVWKKRIK